MPSKSKVKFWVAIGTEEQMKFDIDNPSRTLNVVKDVPLGDQHIVYSEVLMCKDSRDRLKRKLKATKDKTAQVRFHNVPVCKICQEAFKNHPDLPYNKFVNASSVRSAGDIKINPVLLEQNNET